MLLSFAVSCILLAASGICSITLGSEKIKKAISLPIERRQRRSETSVSGTTPIGSDWTTIVSFGGQELRMLIDTGSTLLWTLSTFMKPENLAQFSSNRIFDVAASPTWQLIPDLALDVFYGDGTYGVYGVYGNEVITLGDISVRMPVGAANETVGTLLGPPDDGILGMGFSGPGSPYITFMQSIKEQLPKFLFTLELHNSHPGSLNLGFVDDSKYTGGLQTLPIDNTSNGWWLLDGVTLSSNGQNLSSKSAQFLLGGCSGYQVRQLDTKLIWCQIRVVLEEIFPKLQRQPGIGLQSLAHRNAKMAFGSSLVTNLLLISPSTSLAESLSE